MKVTVFVIFSLVIAGLVVGGVVSFWDEKQFVDRAVRVPGIVVDNVEQEDSDGDITYHARFEFHRLTGDAIQATSHAGSNPASYNKGDSVKVLYEDADPQHAEIDTFWNLWLVPVILTVLACSMFLIMAYVAYALRKKTSPHKH